MKLAEKFKFDAIDDICCIVKIHSNNLSDKQRVIAQKESIESLIASDIIDFLGKAFNLIKDNSL